MGLTGNWDGRISRRTLLRTGGSRAAAHVLLGRAAPAAAAPPFARRPVRLGVASGDPTPNGVVLWTRLAPAPLDGGGMTEELFGVRYEVAADEEFRRIVRRGAIEALARRGAHRPRRDRRAPAGDRLLVPLQVGHGDRAASAGRAPRRRPARRRPVRFAFASCQNYTNGFYRRLRATWPSRTSSSSSTSATTSTRGRARSGVPASATTSRRRSCLSLSDYRTRHAQYRTDPDLQAAHAAFPWLMTWDDHEFKDNYADLDLEPGASRSRRRRAPRRRLPGLLGARAARALAQAGRQGHAALPARALGRAGDVPRARHAPVPLRPDPRSARRPSATPRPATARRARPDARDARRRAARAGCSTGSPAPATSLERARQPGRLRAARHRPRRPTGAFSLDHWDGYVAERQRVLDFLAGNELSNTVVITGDAHENSVRNVPPDFRRLDGPPVATEFIGTSISSEGLTATRRGSSRATRAATRNIKFDNWTSAAMSP